MSSKRYIITGGPCSGKTTVIEALQEKGYTCYHEFARQVIKEQMQLGSNLLPWDNLEGFSSLVLDRMKLQLGTTQKHELSFLDRGVPDIIAYLRNGNVPVIQSYYDVLSENPYHNKVFILPPWEEIYAQDDERKETPEESIQIYNLLCNTYTDLGFTLIVVPRISVEDRLELILSHI